MLSCILSTGKTSGAATQYKNAPSIIALMAIKSVSGVVLPSD